jgi:hypothetical protein
MSTDPQSTPYDARRERVARVLAASLMGLIKDPTGDRLPDECWQQLLPKADSILFITSQPGTQEHHLAGQRLEASISNA